MRCGRWDSRTNLPPMTFDEALAYRKRMKSTPLVDEQDFRHGWNAALRAAIAHCHSEVRGDLGATSEEVNCAEHLAFGMTALEVEVQT